MSVFAILIPEFSAILSPPKMNHYNRFPTSNHMQTGHISICRFTDGLELKYAELQTLSQIESEVRFDPDLRLIFTLEGTTHLQLGKREVFLHASDSQAAVLLPVNQPTDGRKIFYSGRQNELVLFCSSQLLAQMGCPPEVLRLFRSSHLEPHYFHPTTSIQMHLNNLLSVSEKPEIWQNFYRHGQMLLLMGEVLQTLFPVIPSDETVARKRLKNSSPFCTIRSILMKISKRLPACAIPIRPPCNGIFRQLSTPALRVIIANTASIERAAHSNRRKPFIRPRNWQAMIIPNASVKRLRNSSAAIRVNTG